MRTLLFLHIFAIIGVFGQDPGYLINVGVPDCAIACIRAGTLNTTCTENDVRCICTGEGFRNASVGIKDCFRKSTPCSHEDLKKTDCAVNRSCGAYQNNIEPDCAKVPPVYQLLPAKPIPKKDMPGGAYAGIGIAATALVMFSAALLIWFLLQRRKRKTKENSMSEGVWQKSQSRQISPTQTQSDKATEIQLLDSRNLVEGDAGPLPQEIDGREFYRPMDKPPESRSVAKQHILTFT
ncbi:hypothetical protein EJ08DRAFT_163365 [Tothia fuscella]|uniref:CFEM domain-containing protein n=1 Tax=Tothia fuscella TaxID=1048955 RepID=A0A9P4NTW3_9PEZI|nr:hypothetical protein EJ08DRAFT_163365 [Tothia fuscella]